MGIEETSQKEPVLIYNGIAFTFETLGQTAELIKKIKEGKDLSDIISKFPLVVDGNYVFSVKRAFSEGIIFAAIEDATDAKLRREFQSVLDRINSIEKEREFIARYYKELDQKGIGTIIHENKLFAYLDIGPFVMQYSGDFYKFPAARLGVRIVFEEDKTNLGLPVILGGYNHPASKPTDGNISPLHSCTVDKEYRRSGSEEKIVGEIKKALLRARDLMHTSFFEGSDWVESYGDEFRIKEDEIGDLPVTNVHVIHGDERKEMLEGIKEIENLEKQWEEAAKDE